MANLSPVVMIIILAVCVVIALVIGYFIGSRAGNDYNEVADKEKQKHDDLKADVREHFQQTSAIMSRMVDDYRDMYRHMSEGAQKLADLSDEKMVAPPPSPEQITQAGADEKSTSAPARGGDKPAAHANESKPAENTAAARPGAGASNPAATSPSRSGGAGGNATKKSNGASAAAGGEQKPAASAADSKTSASQTGGAGARPAPANAGQASASAESKSGQARHVPIGSANKRK
ncbi:YhcB family protein [Salinisphaera sp. LB1]|uniref:YhcB family protein n=1 Tax=Salinisphaera sp. LB1 TaxID=2183911 RepID=UPI000D7066AD|nr:DUF1043 family protein [Salinisphaera sp. LB1]AWN15729.1 hypothetical protein SALB1_1531 [Salinisphaera sp. LB1]